MLVRTLWLVVLASVMASLAATFWFVAVTLPVRLPYWGEAEVLFEASRLRAHLPLWVDPVVGASEYAGPPSRFYVTYPPLWAWVVSLVPEGWATLFARAASTLAWFGTLASVAWTAPRGSRREALLAAAFIAGIWVLANFATIGRPDSVACALAAFALVRTVQRERLDVLSVALFVLVPWVKPTIVGLPVGAVVGACAIRPESGRRTFAFAVVVAVVSAVLAHVLSGGAIFAHVVRSNAQPFAIATWLAQVPARLPFFAPLFAWAAWIGWRDRARLGTRIALTALGGAVVWTLVALGKTGASSNYWMEPSIAALVLIARAAPGPLRVGGANLWHALAVLASVLWADVASVSGAVDHAVRMRADAAFVAALRKRLGVPGGVIAADEAGIELVLDGRILVPTYQMVHLVRRGAYPVAPWIAELSSPETRAFVEHTGQLRLAPELERALEAHFEPCFEEQGFKVWRRR